MIMIPSEDGIEKTGAKEDIENCKEYLALNRRRRI